MMNQAEVRQLCMCIANHVDEIGEGKRHTAVVEAARDNAPPHLVFVITQHPTFIADLLRFCREHPDARIVRHPEPRIIQP